MQYFSTSSAVVLLLLSAHLVAATSKDDVVFVDSSWKEYVSKDHDPAWTQGKDKLSEAGFKMRPFLGGELDEPIRAPLHSHFGNMTLQLYPPLIKQDFYQQYHQPTFWPYCSSLEECVVYRCMCIQNVSAVEKGPLMIALPISQNVSAVERVPLVIALPPGVGALDFYIDLAIDCVETTNVTMPCQVTVAAAPEPLIVKKSVSSICSSAKVGQYFGFYNKKGGSIEQLTVTCKGEYSRVLGLLRLGGKLERVTKALNRMDFVEVTAV